jgi:hypothetical protein
MNGLKDIQIFLFLLILSGCVGVEFGDDEGPGSSTGSTSREVQGPQSTQSISIANNISGDSVDLLPYIIFDVLNPDQKNLSGITIDLGSGENIKTFAQVSSKLASEESIVLKLPTNIINNSIYITIKGSKGSIREKHLIPLASCQQSEGNDCNKIVVSVDEIKYQELVQ